jgi:hypothetical protein
VAGHGRPASGGRGAAPASRWFSVSGPEEADTVAGVRLALAALFALIVLVVLPLAGCGGGDGEDGVPDATVPRETEPRTVETNGTETETETDAEDDDDGDDEGDQDGRDGDGDGG